MSLTTYASYAVAPHSCQALFQEPIANGSGPLPLSASCTYLAGIQHALLEAGAEEAFSDGFRASRLVKPRLALLVGDDPNAHLHQLRGHVATWGWSETVSSARTVFGTFYAFYMLLQRDPCTTRITSFPRD